MSSSSLSPFSRPPFTPTFTPSLYILYHNPQTTSSKISNISRFKLFCSYQTIEFDAQKIKPTKKKRKPRPSFLEKIEDKWSVKTPSLRQKFPWEEEENQKKEKIQEKIEFDEFDAGTESRTESRIDDNSVVSDGFVKNRVKFAPWDQRNKNKNAHVDFEGESVGISSGRGKKVGEFDGVESRIDESELVDVSDKVKFAPWDQRSNFDKAQVDFEVGNVESRIGRGKRFFEFPEGYVLHSKNLGNVVDKDENFKEIDDDGDDDDDDEVDASSSGILLDEKERYFVKLDEKLSLEGKLSGVGEQGVENAEDFRDGCDAVRPLGDKLGEEDALRKMMPWESAKSSGEESKKSYSMLAEKVIPEPELKRLRNVGLRMVERIKVGAAGITQALVDSIHEKWKVDEIVKLKFEGPTAVNMKRSHDILERRTGGLVIWRSGSSIVLFRGMTYKLQCVKSFTKRNQVNVILSQPPKYFKDDAPNVTQGGSRSSSESSTPISASSMKSISEGENMDLSELNFLLDEIGPRYVDWAGRDPLPVDADLLPNVIPGYKRPFRLLPYGIRPVLKDKEMTFIRRAARTMPPHFALGRNRELQGLAKAMVKLWEKSAIAKIAIKRGIHNTRNERMAEELKRLTGGTLVSRNKDYIVFYRGNDFLPPNVTQTLVKAQNLAAIHQDEEDWARQKAFDLMESNTKASKDHMLVAGTLAETMAATSRWGNQPTDEEREKMMKDSALARHASLVRFLEKKLSLANGKVKKAEKALRKVQDYLEPASLPNDLETLSDEERFLFRKIGLSMKPFLLLGLRGIFDGTIENMHLHWKYRELVKIIVDGKRFAQVKHIAIALEAESGGVLVSVDKTTKGYAIIVYRGKNYRQPSAVRPKNLLTRRQALARSIELQRREALKHHISELQGKIKKLKLELEDMTTVNRISEDTFYSRVDDASDSDEDDDDSVDEDEDEEAYLEVYDSGDENGKISLERHLDIDESKKKMHSHRYS
ncbi:CRM-domain containing factor CFM3, chloroplastic/mitochondrial [Heracleum sosnowskyi]|uniref:CRM-domain containing factor CFM3, chloroplastic/mitochondrial n=1 Tax=Heracleum sosnowskyi TaxID=360622 RepID=A0AAD8H121_9APIA|nr:CRM-domain containing factor CFM3, chloroplastic/mitochondrial [Heracleum sosnowskyi]